MQRRSSRFCSPFSRWMPQGTRRLPAMSILGPSCAPKCGRTPGSTSRPPTSKPSPRHTATIPASVRSSAASCSTNGRSYSSTSGACISPASTCTSTRSATARCAPRWMRSRRGAPPADGNPPPRAALAPLQLPPPADVARIGRDHLYVAFTYSWMVTSQDYDLTVIPFFERVIGNSYQALHRPGSYYEANTYPVRAVKAAGGILTAGSDAPVYTRDPQPFVNMALPITRSVAGAPPLSPQQSISVREVIEAYTINGARMLGLEKDAGSI